MPANQRALRTTNLYRQHAQAVRARAEAITARNWALIGPELDPTHAEFAQRTVPALTQLQTTAARLSGGYLAAYVAASTNRPPAPTGASADAAVPGKSRTGKPLTEALAGPLMTVKKAIADGHELPVALAIGRHQAVRNAGEDVIFAARATLADGIGSSEQIVGWRRVTSGGCGACLALADGAILADDSDIEVHDNCQCTAEPVIRDVPDTVQRPTGEELFHSWTTEHQDQLLGPDKARIVRDGDAPFHALVAHSPMQAIADQITEAPLEALHAAH